MSMSRVSCFTSLGASIAACGLAISSPVLAQTDNAAAPSNPPLVAEPVIDAAAPGVTAPSSHPVPAIQDAIHPPVVYPAPVYPLPAQHGGAPAVAAAPLPAGPESYPPAYRQARADWIGECAYRYQREYRNGHGGLVGGILGAVVGGIAGNRLDHRGDRWAGTLIGAGVGGVAGAVAGSLIEKSGRTKREEEAMAWCEDYLARNTSWSGYAQGAGYGYPPAHGYGAPAMASAMWVPVTVPVRRCHPQHATAEVVEPPVHHTRPARRMIPDKRIKLSPARPKYVK